MIAVRTLLIVVALVLLAPRAEAITLTLPDNSPSLLAAPMAAAAPEAPDPAAVASSHERLRKLQLRRNMLVAHQVLAWTSVVSLVLAEAVGLGNRTALLFGSPERSSLNAPLATHRVLAAVAGGSYYGAFAMSMLMPSPSTRIQDKGFSKWRSTRDQHMGLAIGHAAGMVATVVTGLLMANVAPASAWDALATGHTISGFATAGLLATATIIIARH